MARPRPHGQPGRGPSLASVVDGFTALNGIALVGSPCWWLARVASDPDLIDEDMCAPCHVTDIRTPERHLFVNPAL